MRRFVLALALLLIATPAWAQVAVDAVSSTTILDSPATTASFSGPNIAGSNRYFIVSITADRTGAQPATGATLNSVAMTELTNIDNTIANLNSQLWGLIAPATGVTTVGLSGMNGAGAVDYQICMASFTGVHQTTPTGTVATPNQGVGTTATVLTLTTAANGLNVVMAGSDAFDATVGSGVTALGCATSSALSRQNVGTSTQDANTFTLTSANWNTLGVPLQPAAASTPIRRRVIQQ